MTSTLRALADPTRQRILQLVWERELPAGEIAAEFTVTFGAVSQHLRVLRDAGLVTQRKQGRLRLYRAALLELGPLATMLESMWGNKLRALKQSAEALARRGRTRKSR